MDRKFLDWLWQWPSQVFFSFFSEKPGFSSAKEIIPNFLHKMIELINRLCAAQYFKPGYTRCQNSTSFPGYVHHIALRQLKTAR